jgi:hypothetical protein
VGSAGAESGEPRLIVEARPSLAPILRLHAALRQAQSSVTITAVGADDV